MPSVKRASGQIALPLDWSAGGANAVPLIVGPSNEEAVRYLQHVSTWPVRTAVLIGPARSGRSLMGRIFARTTGGRVIDGDISIDEEAMFHAWNEAQASGKPLLIIANTPPADWQVQLPDLQSRLRAVPVLRIGEPDDCLARDLIETLFAQRGIIIAPDLAGYVVPRMERSYAMIHKIVTALDEASLDQGRRIGIRLARDLLIGKGLIDPDLVERQGESE